MANLIEYKDTIESILAKNIVPFWETRVIDSEHGGYRVERIIAGLQQQNRAARRIRPFSFALPAAAVLLVALGLVFLLRMPDRSVPDTVIVRFQLHAPDAGQVSVVGNWNRWDPQAQKLEDPDGDGVWEIEIPLKRDEEHQYQFLIDGHRWIPDPGAALQVDDGFGGVNSVLQI